ncbi:hypothetical protein ABW636_09540 [Aquimarina sp. 2201CG1-2-11]|uniref:hypothetical protein n=1 Tax=Aquimarina discodermiae TaxID=3231043 RepID=UPI0034617CB1
MKNHIFYMLLMVCAITVGQPNQSEGELPSIVPPSPDVASLGKYGEIPIGYQYGTPNISVPIYQLTEGALSLTISLSYRSEGVKVEEISSNVGMNWSLNAGGVITRQINGIADEYNQPDKKGILHVKPFEEFTNADYVQLFKREIDTESDLFFYNFNGQSGKFYINKEGQAIPVPYRNIKIIPPRDFKAGNPDYWQIITEDGTRYAFGENDKKEINYSEPSCDSAPPSSSFTTGWMLTSMTSYQKDRISFEYEANQQDFYAGTRETRNIISASDNEIPLPAKISCPNLIGSQTQLLTTIKASNARVNFSYSSKQDMIYGGKKLDAVKVYATFDLNTPVEHYDFNYFYTTASLSGCSTTLSSSYHDALKKRLYLEKINRIAANKTEQHYKFDYYEPQKLPSRCSKSQDHRGFYNAKPNTTLVPKSAKFPEGADRNPSQEAKVHKYGILRSITYPTKGKTVFNFEPNMTKIKDDIGKEYDGKSIARFGPIYPANSKREMTTILRKDQHDGYVKFEVRLKIGCESFNPDASAVVEIYKGGGKLKEYAKTKKGNYTFSGTLPPSPHADYKFVAKIDGFPESDCNYFATIDYDYIKYESAIVNRMVGGLRIQSIYNYYADGHEAYERKKFSYNQIGDPDKSSMIMVNGTTPFKYQFHKEYKPPRIGNFLNCGAFGGFAQINSTSSLSLSPGAFLYYTNVLESRNDNSYTIYEFSTHADHVTGTPNRKKTAFDSRRGRLLKKTTYNKNRTKVSVEVNEYTDNDDYFNNTPSVNGNSIENMDFHTYAIIPKLEECSALVNGGLSRFYSTAPFRIVSTWDYLSKKTDTLYDVNGLNPITTTTRYFYDNPTHAQQTRVEVTNSEGKTLKTKISYADDVNNTALKNHHRIAEPVKTETYENGIKLGTKENKYEGFFNNYLVKKVQAGKGETTPLNLLEDQIVYHRYNRNGKPLEVSRANGTKIVYIWGYNEQYPIAKIENASYNEVATVASISKLQTKSNEDTDNCNTTYCKEQILRSALQALRSSLPNAMVTTYTYDPLIGVTSMTDPRGYTTYYRYGDFNRLKEVRDQNSELISDYRYHYQPQEMNNAFQWEWEWE